MGKKVITIICCLAVGFAVGGAGIVGASVLLDFDFGELLSLENQEYVTLPQSGESFTVAASSENSQQVEPGDNYSWTVTLGEGYGKAVPKVIFKDSEGKEINPVGFVEGSIVDGTVKYSFKVTQVTKIEIEPQRNKYAVTVPSEYAQIGYTFESESAEVEHGGLYAFKVILDDDYNLNALTVRANGVVIPEVTNNTEKTITINEDTAITVDVLSKNTYSIKRPAGGAGFAVVDASHGVNVAGISYGMPYSFTVQLEEGYLETAPVWTGTTAGVEPVLDDAVSDSASGKYVYSFDVTQNTELKITAVRDGNTFGVYDNYDVIWPVGVKPVLIEAGATIDEVQAALNEAAAQDIPFEEKWVAFENTGEDDGTTLYEFSKALVIPGINISGNNVRLRFRLDETGRFKHPYNPGSCVVNKGWNDFWAVTPEQRRVINETFTINKIVFEKYDVVVGEMEVPGAVFRCGRFINSKIIDCDFICTVSEEVKDAYPMRGDTPFDAYCSYDGLLLKGCTFENKTDAYMGGIWIRNFYGVMDAKNVLIEDCVFNKRNGDEALAIWADVGPAKLSDVIVRNNVFNFEKSVYKNLNPVSNGGPKTTNPVYNLSFGGGVDDDEEPEFSMGETTDIIFVGNKVYAEYVNCLFHMALTEGKVRRFTFEDNLFEVKGLRAAGKMPNTDTDYDTPIVYSSTTAWAEHCVIRNNTFIINTDEEKEGGSNIKRASVFKGTNLEVVGNEIYGNGFIAPAASVYRFEDNYVEQCSGPSVNINYYINNRIDNLNSEYFYRILWGTAGNKQTSVVRGNTFNIAESKTGAVNIQLNSYSDAYFEYNTFYHPNGNTQINVWNQTDISLTFKGNKFNNSVTVARGSGTAVITEFLSNKFLNAEGVDVWHDSPPTPTGSLLSMVPVGSTISFKTKKGTQTGWVKTTASGPWEIWTA